MWCVCVSTETETELNVEVAFSEQALTYRDVHQRLKVTSANSPDDKLPVSHTNTHLYANAVTSPNACFFSNRASLCVSGRTNGALNKLLLCKILHISPPTTRQSAKALPQNDGHHVPATSWCLIINKLIIYTVCISQQDFTAAVLCPKLKTQHNPEPKAHHLVLAVTHSAGGRTFSAGVASKMHSTAHRPANGPSSIFSSLCSVDRCW